MVYFQKERLVCSRFLSAYSTVHAFYNRTSKNRNDFAVRSNCKTIAALFTHIHDQHLTFCRWRVNREREQSSHVRSPSGGFKRMDSHGYHMFTMLFIRFWYCKENFGKSSFQLCYVRSWEAKWWVQFIGIWYAFCIYPFLATNIGISKECFRRETASYLYFIFLIMFKEHKARYCQ